MLAVFAFPIFLVPHAAILSAQKLGPKSEPAEMSQDYNPLLWHGTEAEFALDTIHDSYCQAALSRAVLQKSANAQVKDLANTLAREQGALNRKLKQMAKTINFHIPHNEKSLAACPDASEIAGHSPVEIDKAYLSFMAKQNSIHISRFQTERDQPDRSENYDLRPFAAKTLPILEKQREMIAACH
jgi:predicted outer membrane protein